MGVWNLLRVVSLFFARRKKKREEAGSLLRKNLKESGVIM
jgi:hypothetical protein